MEDNRAVQLLWDVMAIPSVNGRDDEGSVAEYLCDYFKKEGMDAKVERIDSFHANVTAVLEGEASDGVVIWNGHLDTVPYGAMEDWHTDPSVPVRKGTRLFGRGASDMKSGLCAMVSALCRYKRSGKRPAYTICFIGTCDEEKYGLGAKDVLEKGGMGDCRQILIGEPTGLKLGMAQKGCVWLELNLHGKTSHGAYPEQGCSAVEYGWQMTRQMKSYVESFSHDLLGNSTANVTQMEGGTAPNMIPESCRILMDIRMVPGLTDQMVMERAQRSLAEARETSGGILEGHIQIRNNRKAIEIREDAPLVRCMKRCMINEGIEPERTGINFFTDASILTRDIPDAQVLLFGPGDPSMAHQPDEFVDLEKYEKAVRILTAMIEQKL